MSPINQPAGPEPAKGSDDMAALAKGGRDNTLGFVLRLLGNVPFLFIGYRLYGIEEMGRFVPALVMIDIVVLVCALGEKRGLAQRLTQGAEDGETSATNLVYDGMLASLVVAVPMVLLLLAVPVLMFPSGTNSEYDMWILAAIPAFALTEILLAAQACRYDIATTVRARALVEPWTKSIAAGAFFFVPAIGDGGLVLAFVASIYAAFLTALWSFLRTYGLPSGWRPRPNYLGRMSLRSLPLVGADVIERGTRLLDLFLLGQFTSPKAVAIYFFAKEIASLPQKLKSSFEPILAPVITKNLQTGDLGTIAAQVKQVGFWIIAIQLGIALALTIPGEAVMGLGGPAVVGGTGALAFLMLAEVVASMAVVSESVLVYIAKKRNLAISLGIITLQAVLTVSLILLVRHFGFDEGFNAAGAAAALFLSLAVSSLVKAMLLKRLLGASVGNLRLGLVWATGPAVLVGFAFTFTPEWIELLIGIPAIVCTYGYVIWHKGFGPEDRVLFRKNIGGGAEPEAPA